MFRTRRIGAAVCTVAIAFSFAGTVKAENVNARVSAVYETNLSERGDIGFSEGSVLTEQELNAFRETRQMPLDVVRMIGNDRGGAACELTVYDSQTIPLDPTSPDGLNAGGLDQFGGIFINIGQGWNLAFTERSLCEVDINVGTFAAGASLARGYRLEVYDGCPAAAGGGPTCTGANLLGAVDFTVNIAGAGAINTITVPFAPELVVTDLIYVMLRATTTTDLDQFIITADVSEPLIGTRTGSLTICGNNALTGCDNIGFGPFNRILAAARANPTGLTGACCLNESGMCVGRTTVEDCVFTQFGTFFEGEDCVDFSCPAPCDVVQMMDDLVEGEGTCTDGDVFNNGCNSADPMTGLGAAYGSPTIVPNVGGAPVSLFGTAGTPVFAGRDTDWYELDLTGEVDDTFVTVDLDAEFPGALFITDSNDCLTFGLEATSEGTAGCSSVSASACLPPGTYIIFVSVNPDNAFSLFVPPVLCDGSSNNDDYRITVTAEENCIEVVCPVGQTGQISNLAGNGGVFATTADFGFEVADNFTPAAAGSVVGGTIYGQYNIGSFNPCPEDINVLTDQWTITYYQNDDLNDIPGPVLAQFTEGVDLTVTRSETGRTDGTGQAEVQAFYSHAPVPVTSQNCHWVGLSADGVAGGTSCFFTWLTTPDGDANSAQRTDLAIDWAVADVNAFDQAYCLDIGGVGTNADGCASAIDFTGACCTPFSGCVENLPLADCFGQDGIFIGVDTTCADTDCIGACCVDDLDMGVPTGTATCQLLTYTQCQTATFSIYNFLGVGTDCADSPCASGACCFADGSCADFASNFIVTTQASCEPQLLSTEPGNIFNRADSFTTPPFIVTGGFTEGAACADGDVCPQPNVFNATAVGCNDSATFNNAGLGAADNGSVDQPDISCFGGGPAAEANGAYWLTFTATNTQTLVSTCGTTAVNDTVLAVYTLTNGMQTVNDIFTNGEAFEIACNEDADDPCGGDANNFNAEVCFDTNVGQVYWVQVGSFDTASQGEIVTTITCADDVCDAAPPCATCAADVDGDNDRDGADIQSFANELISPTPNLCADTDSSGTIDLADIPSFVAAVLAGGACP